MEMHAIARGARGPGRLARQGGGDPFTQSRAVRAPRAQGAGRRAGGAYPRAKVEQGLCEIRWAAMRHGIIIQPRRLRRDGGPGAGQGIGHGEKPRRDPFDIAIDGNDGPPERDCRDGRRRIGTDARQGTQALHRVGEPAAHVRHPAGAGMQVARPRVIAKPGPRRHDGILVRVGKVGDRGKLSGEAFEIGNDGGHGRLLQHDFAEPDMIRICRLPRQRAPWQGAAMPVIPAQQFGSRK